MVNNIRKIRNRHGQIIDFNPLQISNAIWQAAQTVGDHDLKRVELLTEIVADKLRTNLKVGEVLDVERVQDTIEQVLLTEGYGRIAKAFILYRAKHRELREIGSLIENINTIDSYLSMSSWKIKENSNMSFSLQGLNTFLTENIISRYWLRKIYPPEIGDSHLSGDFHIHDLGTLGAYCCGWDIEDILIKGFCGVPGKIESSPAKHFNTALMHIVNYMYTLQGETAGAQAISNFDTYLAPFIRADDISERRLKQDLQQFLFNMNVPTRVGFQSPFTNITLDLNVPSHLKDKSAIIGGKLQDTSFGDFQEESDMLNESLAAVMLKGDAKGRPFTFPIPTYNITKDFDWDSTAMDNVWEMTAKYGIPYFSNFINSDMNPEDARSMCCRLRLDLKELQKRGGGLFGSNPKTGSLGVVTINLVRLGYISKTEDDFFEKLNILMDRAKNSLEIKREVVEELTTDGLHPYTKFYLDDVKQRFGQYWKNHFSTIGIIGMNDALLNLIGSDLSTQAGQTLALKILDFMRAKLLIYQQDTGYLYNLEATPAEGASYRLPRLDRIKYPDIRIYNKEKYNGRRKTEPYYTNSSQLPVGFTDDIFDALDLQDELQCKYTGGTVFHGFIGEAMPNAASVKKLVRKIAENYNLPYFTLTPSFSVCPAHGYISGEHPWCPKCKEAKQKTACEVYSRVVGYLRPTSQWNKGKQQEFNDRKTFKVA